MSIAALTDRVAGYLGHTPQPQSVVGRAINRVIEPKPTFQPGSPAAAVEVQPTALDLRWSNKGRYNYLPSQALADVTTGRRNLGNVIPEVAKQQATSVLGDMLLRAAKSGHEHLPRLPKTDGNKADLFVGNEEFLPRLFEDVRKAKKVIDIIQFNWEPDGAGLELATLLKQKVKEGVEVNLALDAYGITQGGLARHHEFFKDLADSGVNVTRIFPKGSGDYKHAFEHRKIYSVDHEVAYMGGLGLGKKYDGWVDLMLRLEGPAAAHAGAQLATIYADRRGAPSPKDLEVLTDVIHRTHGKGDQLPLAPSISQAAAQGRGAIDSGTHGVQLLINRPGVDLAASKQFFEDVESAENRLWITTPYIGSEQITKPLVEAAKRGVDVQVIVPGLDSGRNTNLLRVSRTFYRDLIDNGIKVYELPKMMHAKSWVADNTVNVGSMNLSMASLETSTEVMARVDGLKLRGQWEQFWNTTKAGAREVTPSDLDDTMTNVISGVRKLVDGQF